jgi:hypothetical protein
MFLAQVPVDFVGAVRHLKVFLQPSALDDESLILKTILWEGFAGAALRPWTIHAQRGPTTTIVGYTRAEAVELNKRRALALPSVQAAVGEAIAVPLPSLSPGERYRFSIRLTPTIRITKSEGRRYGSETRSWPRPIPLERMRVSDEMMFTATIWQNGSQVRPSKPAVLSSSNCEGLCGPRRTVRCRVRPCPKPSLKGIFALMTLQSFLKRLAVGLDGNAPMAVEC